MSDREPLVVLGAGLAGLSLADALLDRDPKTRIVLLDRRHRWGRDRTWCTWLTGPLRFADLATHQWSRWELASRGRRVIRHSRSHPYIHLDSRDLYAHVLARIARAPRAEVRTGHRVRAVHPQGSGWIVETDHERVTAARVVDAMGPLSPLGQHDDVARQQRFLGWEIEADDDRFDPTAVTLMDFRGVVDGALTFFYVLPFSSRRALVEHTTIGGAGPSAQARRTALTAEADRRCGPGRWRAVFEERGRIPMSASTGTPARGPGFFTAGAAAGAIRPSSGYAFTRSQRHTERLAAALTEGRGQPAVAPTAHSVLDRLFLAALSRAPDGGEQLLWQLATGLDADRFARFMTDTASPIDDLHVASSIPFLPLGLLRSRIDRDLQGHSRNSG
jgi:lycopene beta-cyclase